MGKRSKFFPKLDGSSPLEHTKSWICGIFTIGSWGFQHSYGSHGPCVDDMPIKNIGFPKLFQFAERCQTLTNNSHPRAFLQVDPYVYSYCGCKKSCTTLDGWNPMNNGINIINHLSTGAGFLPSTVSETSTICAIGQHQLSAATRKPTDFGSLVDPQLIFPGVFVQGEAVKNR